jgi:thiamine kinase-like enzyme
MEFANYDSVTKINNVDVYPMHHYLDKINWDEITQTIPTKLFHGDLQFDNIIYTGTDFKLIDWREDFGGNTVSGDLYYDLAKLNGGMDLNYSIMKDNVNYSVNINSKTVQLDYTIDPILKSISINEFALMVEKNNLSLRKIKLLTGIIYLNMSPLHINNFDIFLFFRAKQIFQEYFSSV